MAGKTPPVVYILHGDNEYAIAQFLKDIQANYADAASVELNVTHMDGSSLRLDELVAAAHAAPFLADRRMVVLSDPLAQMKSQPLREKFLALLDGLPPSAALVLVINRPLVDYRARRKRKTHWLEDWARSAGERAFVREFSIPRDAEMGRWIQEEARGRGGQFSTQAAALLASMVADEPRQAVQEIEKLLAYVNFSRPVEVDDVERLTGYLGRGDVFAMVDALGNKNGRVAQRMLHRLLREDDPLRLFGMVVRQFRLLLLTRELLDAGFKGNEVAQRLKVHPFVARKVISQVHHFSSPTLEMIYRRLLEVDEAIKTGQMEGDLALDTLIVDLTDA
jgi:DNA polymerase-3 subunit delta